MLASSWLVCVMNMTLSKREEKVEQTFADVVTDS